VYVQAEPEFRRDTKQLGLFYVKNKSGGMVPLDTLITTDRAPDRSSPIVSTCSARLS
jgi:multidrug efflux pump subunit AcrB